MIKIVICLQQADIERRLEEGLNSSDPVDFEDLLRTKPDEVISYLANKGTQKLGSFITEVTRFHASIAASMPAWERGVIRAMAKPLAAPS